MSAPDETVDDAGSSLFARDSVTRRRRRIIGIGVVCLVALLQVLTQFLAGRDRGRLYVQLTFLTVGLPFLMWALSASFATATRRRLGAITTLATGFFLAGVIGTCLWGALWVLAQYAPAFRPHYEGGWHLSRALPYGFLYGLLYYGLWALAFVFPFAVEDARVRSLEADKLRLEAEKLRASAELARLRAHLEPHFLLNTLNAVAGLVTDDPREARRLLVCLGDLLRDALRDEDELQTIDQEISWLQRYAAILEARHPGNLVFRWEIAGETRDVLLPRLLLQPLVENAVKHGALKRANGGVVVVRTSSLADGADGGGQRIVCTVEDNGPGIPADETRSGAFGLHAVRRRLQLKYTERAALRLESSPLGTRSIVELPRQPLARAS
jgi:signal transduction histidine kinase